MLTKKILDRKYPMINIDLKKWQLNHLTECIRQLQRYLISNSKYARQKSIRAVATVHTQFKNLIDPKRYISISKITQIKERGLNLIPTLKIMA